MAEGSKSTLNGWKEIAAYLGVSIRAVQQWEKDRALPVRRASGTKGRVWAEPEDIDRWRHELSSPPTVEPSPRRAGWLVAASVSAFVALAAIGISALRNQAEVARVVHDGRQLVATDTSGRVLWSHRFKSVREAAAGYKRPEGIFVDLDDDGRAEVLAQNLPKPDRLEDDGLFCFAASGRLMWQFKPGRSVRTAQGVFDPPYQITKVVAFRSRVGGPWRIAVVSVHSTYFPSQVAVLDEHGKLLREYWHAGHLHDAVAADHDRDGKPELYIVGLSNGYNNAVAIALDPERMEGAGWEESDDYRFDGMKPGVEIARWLTPRTPFSRKASRYNGALAITSNGNQLMTSTHEYFPVNDLLLCLSFGPRLSNPAWSLCDVYSTGFAKCKAQGLMTTETPESEVRGTIGFRDVTAQRQEAVRRSTTERASTR